MTKEKTIPKEYAIVISLIIFFTLVILVGGIRIILSTQNRLNKVDLSNINVLEINTNIDMANYNLNIANAMQEKYGIDIYYGDKLNLESVNAIHIVDDKQIFNMLKEINEAISKYPEDLVHEIESNGYSVSIYLVERFTTNVEALANRNSIGQLKIYISNTIDVQRALHHEYYHILDYYVKLESDESVAYLGWEQYNPDNFKYTADYIYKGESGAHFVTAYAKYSEKEDRSETFAEMMTASRDEVFFGKREPIAGKMSIIKRVLYNTFECVRKADELAWE